jgi:uncharacterized protein involved in exopolysaccharide biosynthesis
MDENKVSVVLYKNWKFILFSTLFIGVTALVVSFFIPKKYQAYATLYPPNSNTLEAVLAKPEFGYELQADRMIQLFDSEKVRDAVVEKFDLINYYELDTTKIGWRHSLNKNYSKDIDYSRTKYLSVVILVTTKDPKLSADIANFLIDLIDQVRKELFIGNMTLAQKRYENQFEEKTKITDSLLSLIYSHSSSKARDMEKDSPIFKLRNAQILEERKKGTLSSADNGILSIPLENQNAKVDKIINEFYFQNQSLNETKQKLKNVNDKISTPMPNSYVISRAEVNDQKVSPSIFLNVILGLGIGLLIGVILTLFRAKIRAIKEVVN